MTGTSLLQADWLGTDAEKGEWNVRTVRRGRRCAMLYPSAEAGHLYPSSGTYQCQPQMPHNFHILTKFPQNEVMPLSHGNLQL